MKKFIWTVIAVLLLGVTLSACGTGRKEAAEGKISVVTTIFPEYDWVRELFVRRFFRWCAPFWEFFFLFCLKHRWGLRLLPLT